MNALRVAFFADSYLEVNGVAHTCRTLVSLAEERQHPFFLVYGGPETSFVTGGSIARCQLRRGPASFAVDRSFRYDLLFYRHRQAVEERLRAFAPDVIHITGPGDVGTLGLVLARKLGVPLCASWHTNLHEYAGRRLEKVMPFLPGPARHGLGRAAQGGSMQALGYFYQVADAVLAPNRELLELLEASGAGPGFLMRRGVDTALFTPERRQRADDRFTIGYTGRLTVEKNVGFLPAIAAAVPGCRFVVVGVGEENERLQAAMPQAEFRGVLRGEALAEAYANMDLFVFPSRTDTFGNAVLEALACGVPAVVTAGGGPKYIVRSGETGFIAETDAAFLRCVSELAQNRTLARRMGLAARRQAMETTWDSVWTELQAAWEAACYRRGRMSA
ncbi:MAG: glycosyltransferase [Acidobacteria bacterium]|nr:glycosyltransferase [Acidobacteriota bacterium]